MRRLIASTVITLTAVVGAAAQPQPLALAGSLSSSVKFIDQRLDEVLSTLAHLAGVSIEFDATVTEDDRARLTGNITLVKSSFADAFAFITRSAGLTYTMADATTVRISKQP
jgi:hypothetical protein